MADPNKPVEPEVESRIPLEPEQLAQALNNCIIGQTCERVFAFVSQKDGRQRYVVVFESGAALLFAPDGQCIVMTMIQDIKRQPTPQQG